MCSMDFSCAYAFYEGNECILFNIDGELELSRSNEKIIYQKVNFEFQKKLTLDSSEILANFECFNSSEYWSLKTNSCLPCKPGFIKYSVLSFNCYHSRTELKNFIQSKSYCESMGGVLFRPKTLNERYFFIQIFPNKTVNVDSTIKSVGEIFKWLDGSDVVGFRFGEPNNLFGSKTILKEACIELRSNGYFYDIPCSNSYFLTICQHD
ncbi:unnamed protein product [Brachionus calyciflorus]|uniref:C-type lectin domain-containing protein n=1 Tax=Brachionus calyciflorus TaxID=104777 RepID=A0A813WJ74_9BILA|nr:unnamed protein product [Brachionus calyciflorus]